MHDPMPSAWFFRLKAAQRDLIKRCGGVCRAGEIVALSPTQMSRFNRDEHPDLMGVPVVLMLEADCRAPLVTEAMAEMLGRRLSDADENDHATEADVQMRHAEAMVRMGEMVTAAAMAFADNRLTPAEIAVMDRAAAGVDRAVADLRQALAAARGK